MILLKNGKNSKNEYVSLLIRGSKIDKIFRQKEEVEYIKDGIQVIPVTDAKAAIKFAIIDAIRETVKECSENVKLYFIDLEQSEQEIDKNSILSIADKLMKEL